MSDQLMTPRVRLNLQEGQFEGAGTSDRGIAASAEWRARGHAADFNAVGEGFLNLARARAEAAASAQIGEAENNLRREQAALTQQYLLTSKGDAVRGFQDYVKQTDELQRRYADRYGQVLPSIRDAIGQKAQTIRTDALINGDAHALQQTIAWRDEENAARIRMDQDDLIEHYGNSVLREKYMARLHESLGRDLKDHGVSEGSEIWKQAFRAKESYVHSTVILDRIERDQFGAARQYLDAERDNMDQARWLELDRMLWAKQKAASEAVGKAEADRALFDVFDTNYREYKDDPMNRLKARQEAALELGLTELRYDFTAAAPVSVVQAMPSLYPEQPEVHVPAGRGQEPSLTAQKREKNLDAMMRRRLDELTEAKLNYGAYVAAFEAKNEYALRVNWNNSMAARDAQITSMVMTEYVNNARRTGAPLTVENFKKFNGGDIVYGFLVQKHNGNTMEAEKELRNRLDFEWSHNPARNPAATARFENWLAAAKPEDLARMDRQEYELQFGRFMDTDEASDNYRKLLQKQQDLSAKVISDNTRLLRGRIQSTFKGVKTSLTDREMDDPEAVSAYAAGKLIERVVSGRIAEDPVFRQNGDFDAAWNNVMTYSLQSELQYRVQSIGSEVHMIRQWCENHGIEDFAAFISWVTQQTGDWQYMSDTERRALYDAYVQNVEPGFDVSRWERRMYGYDEINAPVRGFDPVTGYPADPEAQLELPTDYNRFEAP